MKRSRQAGLTMLEVLIASVILCFIVLSASWLVWTSADSVANAEAFVKVEKDMREVLDTMVKEFHQCHIGNLQQVITTKPIPTDAASMAAAVSPGTINTGTPPYPIWDPRTLVGPPYSTYLPTPQWPPNTPNNVFTNAVTPTWDVSPPVGSPTPPAAAFDGIRFRIAGPVMELTAVTKGNMVGNQFTKTGQQVMTTSGSVSVDGSGATKKVFKNTANADANGTVDPWYPSKKVNNFDLAKFKAGLNPNDLGLTYEITYWWEIDQQASQGFDKPGFKGEGAQNPNSPSGYVADRVDNNKNGVVDEGVIKKMETWFNNDGTVDRRVITTVCRDVTALQFSISGWPDFVNQKPLDPIKGAVPANAYKVLAEKNIMISITIKKADPRYPNDPKKTFIKTLTTVVDLRNQV
ncbi:MAG: type II secretion system protein [Planctomycetaceae bacterium]|nr:type II secretion system protein [Planctomycetaceae bacterium]